MFKKTHLGAAQKLFLQSLHVLLLSDEIFVAGKWTWKPSRNQASQAARKRTGLINVGSILTNHQHPYLIYSITPKWIIIGGDYGWFILNHSWG